MATVINWLWDYCSTVLRVWNLQSNFYRGAKIRQKCVNVQLKLSPHQSEDTLNCLKQNQHNATIETPLNGYRHGLWSSWPTHRSDKITRIFRRFFIQICIISNSKKPSQPYAYCWLSVTIMPRNSEIDYPLVLFCSCFLLSLLCPIYLFWRELPIKIFMWNLCGHTHNNHSTISCIVRDVIALEA